MLAGPGICSRGWRVGAGPGHDLCQPLECPCNVQPVPPEPGSCRGLGDLASEDVLSPLPHLSLQTAAPPPHGRGLHQGLYPPSGGGVLELGDSAHPGSSHRYRLSYSHGGQKSRWRASRAAPPRHKAGSVQASLLACVVFTCLLLCLHMICPVGVCPHLVSYGDTRLDQSPPYQPHLITSHDPMLRF